MHDLSFWQALAVWAGMTLLLIQAVAVASVVAAVLWLVWRLVT